MTKNIEVTEDVENAIAQYKEQLKSGTNPFTIVQDIVDNENYDGLFDDYVTTKAGIFLELNTLFDNPECLDWVQFMLADIDLSQDIFLISAGKPVNVTKERVEDLIHHFEM